MLRDSLFFMRSWIRLGFVVAVFCTACDPAPVRTDGSVEVDAGPGSDECLAPRTECGSQCVDTNSDPRHCGECNNRCDSFCSEGECATSCAGSLMACGDACVDLATSSDHCGECDNPCTADRMCVSGGCVCGMGLSECGDTCVDRMTSTEHCGRCDNPCEQDEICAEGTCQPGAEADCLDGMDNDMDGDADCEDSDCFGVERDCTCSGGMVGDMPTELCEMGTWSTCGPCGPAPDCSASNPCDYGYDCTGGTCVFNPGYRYDVEVVDAPFIPMFKYMSSSTWDSPFFRNPDPYVEFLLTPGVSEGRSSGISDTFTPVWNEVVLLSQSASDLMSYFEIRLYDEDTGTDDVIGCCSIVLRERDFDGRLRTVTCAPAGPMDPGPTECLSTPGFRANIRLIPSP